VKLGKVLKTTKINGMDEQEALLKFLKRYRETPDSTPGVTGIPSMDPIKTLN
jgi:hypothetical protein